MNKSYEINIVEIKNTYYVLDFTITRPVIQETFDVNTAIDYARGYKKGIEIESKSFFKPIIAELEKSEDLKDYIENKKKYFNDLWKKEKKNEGN